MRALDPLEQKLQTVVNPSPLGEQPVLLTSEPSLLPQGFCCCRHCWLVVLRQELT